MLNIRVGGPSIAPVQRGARLDIRNSVFGIQKYGGMRY
jgi:hypothetical protein